MRNSFPASNQTLCTTCSPLEVARPKSAKIEMKVLWKFYCYYRHYFLCQVLFLLFKNLIQKWELLQLCLVVLKAYPNNLL